jgi:hypothetical protein
MPLQRLKIHPRPLFGFRLTDFLKTARRFNHQGVRQRLPLPSTGRGTKGEGWEGSKKYAVRKLHVPQGLRENSPAFQRRVAQSQTISPAGTADN